MAKFLSILICLTLFVAFLDRGNAYCFAGYGCRDASTSKTYSPGDTWTTNKCEECSCHAGQKEYLKTCLRIREDMLWRAAQGKWIKPAQTKVVLVPYGEKDSVKCQFEISKKKAQAIAKIRIFQRVDYYTVERNTMQCCATYGTPVNVADDCEAIWIQEECKYKVVDIATKGPCDQPMSMVGK
ncbi:uncharacterized protein LOC143469270 [Clavelina lepadiformis]|uniref:uncharacterized protein LOC143469270 n=1 Tax=Clavelina lepadiformis TaxID=159417 RepID=UPI004041CF9D